MFFVIVFLCTLAAFITVGILYAVSQWVKISWDLHRLNKKMSISKEETLIQFSTYFTNFKNAKDDTERFEIIRKIEALERFVREYY